VVVLTFSEYILIKFFFRNLLIISNEIQNIWSHFAIHMQSEIELNQMAF